MLHLNFVLNFNSNYDRFDGFVSHGFDLFFFSVKHGFDLCLTNLILVKNHFESWFLGFRHISWHNYSPVNLPHRTAPHLKRRFLIIGAVDFGVGKN